MIRIDVATVSDLSAFQKMADGLDGINDRMKTMTQGMKSAASSANTYGGGSGRGPKPGVGGANSPYDQFRYLDAMNKASGGTLQNQRNSALKNAFQSAQSKYAATGDPKALAQMNTLSSAMGKLTSGQSPLMTLLRSTRFNMGGVSPLVGRSMDALTAMGPKFAALAGPVAIVATAFTALIASTMTAATRLNDFTSGMLAAGTSISTYSSMQKAGSLFGGDIAGRAQKLQDAISKGGIAQMQAMQAGINPIGGPFGDRDVGGKFMTALKDVMYSGSFDEARRKAQNYGQADLARSYRLSDSTKKYMLEQGSAKPTQAQLGQAEEFTFWLEEAKRTGMEFVRVVGTPFLRALSSVTRMFTGITNTINGWMNSSGGQILMHMSGIGIQLLNQMGGNSQVSGLRESIDALTNATMLNVRAMGDQRGVFGGATRANHAFPSRASGRFMNDKAYREKLNTGLL